MGARPGGNGGPGMSASRDDMRGNRGFQGKMLSTNAANGYAANRFGSASSLFDSSMPVFRTLHNCSSESILDGSVRTQMYPTSASGLDATHNHHEGAGFNHLRYYDSSSTEEFDDGVVTPPQAVSSFMNISPEEPEEVSESRNWLRRANGGRLRSLFSRSAKGR